MKKVLTNNNFGIFSNIVLENEKFFNDVRDYMKSVDWTWFHSDFTPTISDLKDNVTYLMRQSIKSDYRNVGTGGFMLHNKTNKLIIEFNEKENPDKVKFKLEVNLNELRLKKLDNII